MTLRRRLVLSVYTIYYNSISATEELRTMNRMVITDANAAAVSNRLKNITADRKFLNKFDVVFALDILEKVVDNGNTSGEVLINLIKKRRLFNIHVTWKLMFTSLTFSMRARFRK